MLTMYTLFDTLRSSAAVSQSGSLSYLTIAIIICIVIVAIGAIVVFINIYLGRKSHKKTEGAAKSEQQPSPIQTTRPPDYPSAPFAQQSQYEQPSELLWRDRPQNVYAGDPYRTDPFSYDPLGTDPFRENPLPPEQYQAQWGAPYPYPPQGAAPPRVCRYCGAYVGEGVTICPNCQNPIEEFRV
jgi:hypothetical protein